MQNVIQIAGVIDQAEASMLMDCGVEYLGFPLRLAYHQEDLSEAEAGAIIRALPPPCAGVLITYLDQADEIDRFCRELGARHVQLHGGITVSELKKLRALNPDLCIFKSLVVEQDNTGELRRTVEALAPLADAFITDTFDPATGARGATGKTHDWNISRMLVELSPKPVILAGGLNAENVREAILAVRPAGVDSHTGVEGPDGRKDHEKVKKFVREARAAFAGIKGS
ncbi:MAG TPA: phosphoribosylanthranilate isomerase [Kiritimatiellia bacterium]|nr:phosphoribosylanthranilate isomerase [Kiritimatiellia bacterium]